MTTLLQYLTVLLSAAYISAWPQYIDLVPNALGVPWTIALGHYCVNGGGPLSPFGWDFAHNNYKWNLCLACADSDNDGFPNGWELGDPCGNWIAHSNPFPCWKDDISHPGNASSVPLTRTVDWSSTCGFNPCENEEIVQCVSELKGKRPHIGVPMNLHLPSSSSSAVTPSSSTQISTTATTPTILRGTATDKLKTIRTSTKDTHHQHLPVSPEVQRIRQKQQKEYPDSSTLSSRDRSSSTATLAYNHPSPSQPQCSKYNPRPSHQP